MIDFKVHDLEFIHYTSAKKDSKFDPSRTDGKENMSKPRGLWASPEQDKRFYTWIDWVKNEGYEEDSNFGYKYSFKFKIDKSSKIYVVHDERTANDYIQKYMNHGVDKYDYEHMLNQELYKDYDGMFLYHGNNYHVLHRMLEFNIWDVDSIVVWNYEKIITL